MANQVSRPGGARRLQSLEVGFRVIRVSAAAEGPLPHLEAVREATDSVAYLSVRGNRGPVAEAAGDADVLRHPLRRRPAGRS